MNTPPNPVNVKLTLERDPAGQMVWQMDAGSHGKGGPNNYPKISVGKDAGVPFTFTITGQNAANVTFVPMGTADGPLCIAPMGATYASPPCPSSSPQISGMTLPGGGKVLRFTDLNDGGAQSLVYQLNFVGAPPLDPIIENGGNGFIGGGSSAMMWLVGGAFLLALAFFLFRGRSRGVERDVHG